MWTNQYIDQIMEDGDKINRNDVNKSDDDAHLLFPNQKNLGILPNIEDEKQADLEEPEQSATATNVRRRSFKKPKPLFYIGGCNGAHVVEDCLTSLGWERITDKMREDFKLKWCEIKSQNNYHNFREGEQLCYQIPNNKLLTTKIGMLTSLQEYDRVMNKVKKGKPRILNYHDFFPETYRLDVKDDRELFFETYADNELWISKPTGLNQGKGIYLIRNREDLIRLQEKISDVLEDVQNSRKLPFKLPLGRIVQRYVQRPLLLEGKKFDIRNYLLIASTNPFVVFYGDGYCRLTCMPYDLNSTDLTGHLTNQFMQKKNPLYEEVKEETVWSMDRFNDYVNDNFANRKGLPEDWVNTVLRKRCQQVMLHCFQAVRHKLESRLGFFDLLGCDFLIDEDFKISLLEMNCNPALHTNCDVLKEVIPIIVGETIGLALEIFDKTLKRERIMPLAAQSHFVLLYNGDSIEAAERRERLQSAAEARRRARSAQRRKKFNPSQFVYKRTANNPTTASVTTTAPYAGPSSTSSTINTASNHVTTDVAVSSVLSTSLSTSTANNNFSPYRPLNISSSTVTALTVSSQQRVNKMKTSTTSLKPFYAGGTVTVNRPYSAPKVNRKYAQVESKIMTHNTLYSMESPRRDSINNAALSAASNCKIANYIQKSKSILTPKGDDVTEVKDFDDHMKSTDVENPVDVFQEMDALEREFVFERIQEEADEMEFDEDDEDEELLAFTTSPSPEIIRRPSAKLPPNYHNTLLHNSFFSGAAASWPRYSPSSQSMQKKITRISSLSVKGNTELPLPAVTSFQQPPRIFDQNIKMQYRIPTTVRLRQSLPATNCTLEIGPKSRRGLIAVSTGKPINPQANEVYSPNRKLNNTARLKLINTNNNSDAGEDNVSPSHVYLSTNHCPSQVDMDATSVFTGGNNPVTGSLVHGAAPIHFNTVQSNNQANIRQVQVSNVKLKTDSCTQTSRRSNNLYNGEEKVIWRLRSRVADSTNKTNQDGCNTPVSQDSVKKQKVLLKVPVVTQSPGLISHRKGTEKQVNQLVLPVKKKVLNSSNNLSISQINHPKLQNPLKESKDTKNTDCNIKDVDCTLNVDLSNNSSEKPTALSRVVAIATAVPTHPRSNEGKVKSSGTYSDEHAMLTAG